LVIGICKIVIGSHSITSLYLRSYWRRCNSQNLDDHPLGSRMLRVHTQKMQVFVRDFLENAVNLIRENHRPRVNFFLSARSRALDVPPDLQTIFLVSWLEVAASNTFLLLALLDFRAKVIREFPPVHGIWFFLDDFPQLWVAQLQPATFIANTLKNLMNKCDIARMEHRLS
jgi:hypothetical protein